MKASPFRSTLFASFAGAAVTLAFMPAVAADLKVAQAKPAPAASAKPAYEPEVGQAGKDVVWVPTPQVLVDKMLDMSKVTPSEFLMDLGSGDGRTVITAAKRGVTAKGIEYNPDMVAYAKRNAEAAGVTDKATFEQADLFKTDLTKAQVITMFLLPSINTTLRPTLLELKPGTRIVSNTFRMGDWEPDETATITDNCTSWCTALLWIIPAKVDGAWTLDGQDLAFKQTFQVLTGTLGKASISDAKVTGEAISFTVDGKKYAGTVNGNTIKGDGWTATKKS